MNPGIYVKIRDTWFEDPTQSHPTIGRFGSFWFRWILLVLETYQTANSGLFVSCTGWMPISSLLFMPCWNYGPWFITVARWLMIIDHQRKQQKKGVIELIINFFHPMQSMFATPTWVLDPELPPRVFTKAKKKLLPRTACPTNHSWNMLGLGVECHFLPTNFEWYWSWSSQIDPISFCRHINKGICATHFISSVPLLIQMLAVRPEGTLVFHRERREVHGCPRWRLEVVAVAVFGQTPSCCND